MKVTLMPNFTREHAYATTLKLCEILDNLSISYSFCGSFKYFNVPFKGKINVDEDSELIIAIGGDGTMTRAAKLALSRDIPVLGVNAGSLAFLMGLDSDDLPLIENLITKEYRIEERLVIKITAFDKNNNSVFSDYCINDAVFARGAEIRLASFDLFCDDKFVNRYKADGLILSTPTGSTAYNLASGGPIVDPRVDSILMTPICPHSLVERTVLFSSTSVLTVKNPAGDFLLSCDGGDSINFLNGYSAQIRKSEKKVRFIRLKDDTFMDILNKKMKIK